MPVTLRLFLWEEDPETERIRIAAGNGLGLVLQMSTGRVDTPLLCVIGGLGPLNGDRLCVIITRPLGIVARSHGG